MGILVTGKRALILPCLGRSERDQRATGEQFVTVENSMGVVHSSQGRLSPASTDLLSEVAIICGMAQATLPKHARLPWADFSEDYSLIRQRIAAVLPDLMILNNVSNSAEAFTCPTQSKCVFLIRIKWKGSIDA